MKDRGAMSVGVPFAHLSHFTFATLNNITQKEKDISDEFIYIC